ncbi:cilia- and flagella-associated protein 157-like [Hippoglossus hippoglossus]|uniref:cilia- and flagella-associated protein 157-like n=1 Tax=Hippoglossus hippoglossus TaxID=8267 RepID=UPI00148BD569|nr:cilia- and flagella-associated protein 157-like [Hippoglossus hippoglossus]
MKTEETSPDEQRDRERDLFLNQIQYLTDQLERYQLKCDDFEQQSKDFTSQYCSLEKDKNDIADYLKRSLLEKEDEVEELYVKLETQRQAAGKDKDALQLEHAQMNQELRERIEELSGENKRLESSLASLEEFKRQREQLTSNMESLEKQLTSQEEKHTADLHNLEMTVLLEKKRLEKEMENHEVNMAINVQRLVDQQLPEETKQAFEENTELLSRCSHLSEQAEALIRENSALQEHKSKHSVDSDILEEMNRNLSRKVCIHKKVVKQVTDQSEQLQAELSVCRQEQQQLQAELRHVLVEMETLRSELKVVFLELNQGPRDLQSPPSQTPTMTLVLYFRQVGASVPERPSDHSTEVSRLKAELQVAKRTSRRMKSVMQEAVDTLRQTLTEALEEQDSEAGLDRWNQLMQKLLVVMDTGTSSSGEDLTSDPAAASAATLDPVSSFQFQLARYRPGDLGLVPPPAQRHLLSRTGPGSFPSLPRKLSGQKTSGSVNKHNKHK